MNAPIILLPQQTQDALEAASGCRSFLAGIGIVASLLVPGLAVAQVAPSLGSEAPFGVVSSTFTNTAAGTTINGNLCFTTGPAFPATVTGTTGACPAAAGTDQLAALAILNGQACTPLPAGPLEAVVIGANPPGTIPPGCYTRVGAIDITASGIVRLNGNGVYIFKSTGGALTTGANSSIILSGGACADNVFWAPVGAATLGATSAFVGNILDAAGVTIGLNASVLGRALAFGGTVSTSSSTITVPTACTPPTIRVTKVSNGGIGSFGFTGSNGFAPQTITTVTAGTGVAGAIQTLTAAGTVTTITESVPPAGFSLASIACSGLGAGGTATPSLATRTITLDAAATANTGAISCTFTNTFAAGALPTMTITKVSNGGVGSFGFTGTNGFAPQTIATVTPGIGVTGATQTLTAAGVATTITESAPPGGFSLASISCSGLGAGGTATLNLATRSVTLDAAATATGANIACAFTNTQSVAPGAVPTLSEWAMILLAGLVSIAGFAAMRGRQQQ